MATTRVDQWVWVVRKGCEKPRWACVLKAGEAPDLSLSDGGEMLSVPEYNGREDVDQWLTIPASLELPPEVK